MTKFLSLGDSSWTGEFEWNIRSSDRTSHRGTKTIQRKKIYYLIWEDLCCKINMTLFITFYGGLVVIDVCLFGKTIV